MAKIRFEGLDEYVEKIRKLGMNVEGTLKEAAYPAAGMVIEAIKAACPVDSGDLRDDTILVKFKNEDGFVYTQVVFEGYDRKGVPNALKANVLESGSSTHSKKPFIRPAVNKIKKAAETAIEIELNKIIDRKMNS